MRLRAARTRTRTLLDSACSATVSRSVHDWLFAPNFERFLNRLRSLSFTRPLPARYHRYLTSLEGVVSRARGTKRRGAQLNADEGAEEALIRLVRVAGPRLRALNLGYSYGPPSEGIVAVSGRLPLCDA